MARLATLLLLCGSMAALPAGATDLLVDEWLVLGTVPFERDTDPFDVRPAAKIVSAAPDEGAVIEGMAWQSLPTEPNGHVELTRRGYEPEEIVTAYLHAYLFSPEERSATVSVGSDDGIQVFVNGTEVHRNWTLRGWRPDQDAFPVRLGRGWNRLLLRVANQTGGFGASARILEADGLVASAGRPEDYAPVRTPPFPVRLESRPGSSLVRSADGALAFPLVNEIRNLGTDPAGEFTLRLRSADGRIDTTASVSVPPGSSEQVLETSPEEIGRAVASGTGLLLDGEPLELTARDVLRVLTGDPPLRRSFAVPAPGVERMLENWHWGEVFRPDLFDGGEPLFREALDAYLDGDETAFGSHWNELRDRVNRGAEAIRKQRVTFVGNSHIDMAWLWNRKETIEVVDMTFDQALKFMEEYPFFNYAQSQMQAYAWVEKLFPEMMRRMDAAVEKGRWLPVGGMWVEPDCNLPSGESFVRQLLYGKGYVRDRYGIDVRIGWNPDSFGYARTLPMIFKGAGIDYFITQKIGWNDTTEFPHRLFWWEAPDGSRVLSYFPFTYVDDARPEVLAERLAHQQEQQPGLTDMLNLYGVGDHGGGPTREMIERYVSMSKVETFPTVEHAHPREFMERVEQAYRGRIPVWDDELYLEYHRGTFTTQAEMKRRNRGMESALESSEKFATLAAALVEDYAYPDEKLDGAWLRTLFNQFHDILPGSSIPEVFVDARADYDEAESLVSDVAEGALEALAGAIATGEREGVPIVVFNPLSWTRTESVSVPLSRLGSGGASSVVVDSEGTPLPSQVAGEELLFLARDVPGIGYRTFWVAERQGRISNPSLPPTGKPTLENPRLRAEIDPKTGDLRSLVLLPSGREMLQPDRGGNVLQLFGDEPDRWDAWNIGYTGEEWGVEIPAEVKFVERGPLRSVIRIIRKIGNSTLTHDYLLAAESPLLEIRTHAVWEETHKFLKSAFFLEAEADAATYEIPYGTICRTTRPQTEAEKAKWEVPGQRWVDLTDRSGGFGVTLVNDSKYGFDAVGSTLRISLLRAPNYPDPEADIGEHRFAYALYPHVGDWKQADSYRRGAEFNLPLVPVVVPAAHEGPLHFESELVSADTDHVVLSALKAVRDRTARPGFVLRVNEVEGRAGKMTLRFPFPLGGAWSANLMEDRGEPLPFDGNSVTLPVGPFELKSVLVRPRR